MAGAGTVLRRPALLGFLVLSAVLMGLGSAVIAIVSLYLFPDEPMCAGWTIFNTCRKYVEGCLISSDPLNHKPCDYSYALGSIAIAAALASFLYQCTQPAALVNVFVASFNVAWWAVAGVLITAEYVGAQGNDYPGGSWRQALMGVCWAGSGSALLQLAVAWHYFHTMRRYLGIAYRAKEAKHAPLDPEGDALEVMPTARCSTAGGTGAAGCGSGAERLPHKNQTADWQTGGGVGAAAAEVDGEPRGEEGEEAWTLPAGAASQLVAATSVAAAGTAAAELRRSNTGALDGSTAGGMVGDVRRSRPPSAVLLAARGLLFGHSNPGSAPDSPAAPDKRYSVAGGPQSRALGPPDALRSSNPASPRPASPGAYVLLTPNVLRAATATLAANPRVSGAGGDSPVPLVTGGGFLAAGRTSGNVRNSSPASPAGDSSPAGGGGGMPMIMRRSHAGASMLGPGAGDRPRSAAAAGSRGDSPSSASPGGGSMADLRPQRMAVGTSLLAGGLGERGRASGAVPGERRLSGDAPSPMGMPMAIAAVPEEQLPGAGAGAGAGGGADHHQQQQQQQEQQRQERPSSPTDDDDVVEMV